MSNAIITKDRIFTVSEVTAGIKAAIENNLVPVWIEGEVSSVSSSMSGHTYFTLKDEFSELPCALFKYAAKGIKFKIENGLKALCYGRISVYEKKGKYQLYIDKMEPKGLGALQLAFQQLKERLAKEGLFDKARKRPIPFLPARIGIVTSPTGAAIRDILNVLGRRFANVSVTIYPVLVQGKEAAGQIAAAIDEFNRIGEFSGGRIEAPDVLMVTRGGGSLEDLWAFNEEPVARAIFNSAIPVISAVGHEIDWTISDFAADLRAPTPSAAAELVIARKEELSFKVENGTERLKNAMQAMLGLLKSNLESLSNAYVLRQPLNVIRQYQQRVDELFKNLSLHMTHTLELSGNAFGSLAGKLDVLSPLSILSRGYSITKKASSGQIIKDAKSLKRGDKILTRLHKGKAVSKIEEILP